MSPPAAPVVLELVPPPPEGEPRTLLVLGAARGGTSMVAGTLRVLGVPMGRDLNGSHEDRAFRQALLGDGGWLAGQLAPLRRVTRFRRLVKARNVEHATWGLKDPNLNPRLRLLAGEWRNPVYVLVLRDPAAVAASQARHFGRPEAALRGPVEALYADLQAFVAGQGRPALQVCYEAAVADPATFVAALSRYAGVTPDDEVRTAAEAFVDPARGYQWIADADATLLGFWRLLPGGVVRGWAFDRRDPGSLELALRVRGKEVARAHADMPRPDVRANPAFGRLACGFEFSGMPGVAEAARRDVVEIVDVASGRVLPRA